MLYLWIAWTPRSPDLVIFVLIPLPLVHMCGVTMLWYLLHPIVSLLSYVVYTCLASLEHSSRSSLQVFYNIMCLCAYCHCVTIQSDIKGALLRLVSPSNFTYHSILGNRPLTGKYPWHTFHLVNIAAIEVCYEGRDHLGYFMRIGF